MLDRVFFLMKIKMLPMNDKEICISRITKGMEYFSIRRFHDSENIFFRMYTAGQTEVWQKTEYLHCRLSIALLILLAQNNGELLIEDPDINTSLTITITPQIKISGMDFDV